MENTIDYRVHAQMMQVVTEQNQEYMSEVEELAAALRFIVDMMALHERTGLPVDPHALAEIALEALSILAKARGQS